MIEKILIIGASGQLGMELAAGLAKQYSVDQVITSDIREGEKTEFQFIQLDILDKNKLSEIIKQYKITQIYLLAALLSATGEKNPKLAWDLNMNGLLNVLDLSVELGVKKVFWPSSIAVFGPNTPRIQTPQHTVMDPNTMYGITKLAGERLCEYYYLKKGLDVRSIRYPGLISFNSPPGGGTTDYAVHIYYEAIKHQKYTCFLSKDTELPMLYMPDAVTGTLQLMDAEASKVKIRSSYNLAGVSFTPDQIAAVMKKHYPTFEMSYEPDFRQAIADSWPQSIDDSVARADWGWKPKFDLESMSIDMLTNLKKILQTS